MSAVGKYPSTPYIHDFKGDFNGGLKHVVVTHKLDGECTSMYRDGIHARSLNSGRHPSRDMVFALHASIKNRIPPRLRLVGENIYAVHSIKYERVPMRSMGFFLFAVFDMKSNTVLGWSQTVNLATLLGLSLVPVIARLEISSLDDIVEKHDEYYTGQCVYLGGLQEGYVVRNASPFSTENFSENVFKYVRPNHVQPDEKHWLSKPVVKNGFVGFA
jgi:hypothetical protein